MKNRYQKEKENKMLEQYDMAQEIVNKTGINIVTCGNCGDVLLHNINEGLYKHNLRM